MKTNNLSLLIMALLVSVLLASCSLANQDNLDGTTWQVVALDGVEPIQDSTLTIEFLDGQVSGSAGCNHFGGGYRVKGEQIEFDSIYSTEMYCMEPEGIMDQEMKFLQLLSGAVRYTDTGDELLIYNSDGLSLKFQPHLQ